MDVKVCLALDIIAQEVTVKKSMTPHPHSGLVLFFILDNWERQGGRYYYQYLIYSSFTKKRHMTKTYGELLRPLIYHKSQDYNQMI